MHVLNRTTKRILTVLLTMCILLDTQDFLSLAGEYRPESLSENSMPRETEELPESEQLKKTVLGSNTPGETVSENDIPKGAAPGNSVLQNDIPESSVSQNDIPESSVSQNDIPESSVSQNDILESSVSQNSISENSVSQNSISENSVSENSLFRMRRASRAGTLSPETLKKHTVKGVNPEQAVVTLFDYWKDDDLKKTRDERRLSSNEYLTEGHNYAYGISKDHMLLFGKFDGFGPWNTSWRNNTTSTSAVGMVKNKLEDGCPVLNLGDEKWNVTDYLETVDGTYFYKFNSQYGYRFPEDFLTPDENGKVKAKEESLAYLFSPDYLEDSKKDDYREIYKDVRGLFQRDADGYYYYNSKENFAEYDPDSNSFILYDSPGVARDNSSSKGQFFPFNRGEEVFNTESDGRLSYNGGFKNCIDGNPGENMSQSLNHYFGFTLEVPFLQPTNGILPEGATTGGKDMVFTFSGDDDVWIFIDDVLVADLGGSHGAMSLSINFATGVVQEAEREPHTIRNSFEEAYGSDLGGVRFKGETFADNTAHTLKMFYMERGHYESNLSLRFNIQLPKNQKLKKVNQEGELLDGASFQLYPAELCEEGAEGGLRCTSTVSKETIYVKQAEDDVLARFTAKNGQMEFTDNDGNGFKFEQGSGYFILKEDTAPSGYRKQPVDIVLEYNRETGMISVANRWTSGAYASFTSYVYEQNSETTYGQYQADGIVVGGDVEVSEQSRKNGLVLAVPMVKGKSGAWLPLYGSNTDGFHTVGPLDDSPESMRRTLLNAALHQCLYETGWYLEWDDEKSNLEGELADLPGRADRYRHVNPDDFDMRMMYIIIEPQAFTDVGITSGSTSKERYQNLRKYIKQLYEQKMEAAGENGDTAYAADQAADQAASALYGAGGETPGERNVSMMDTSQFLRIFRSLLYVANEQRELRVQKVDQIGRPMNGVMFGLYTSEAEAKKGNASRAAATGVTANIGGQRIEGEEGEEATIEGGVDGMLVIRPQVPRKKDGTPEDGYVPFSWVSSANQKYYLREISGPAGYELNTTVIPVVVGIYSIYADAGTEEDGVSVRASVGHLYHTMKKYASDGEVNITLRDIKAVGQVQPSKGFQLYGWKDNEEEIALHYGINLEQEMDYGCHDGESWLGPFLETKTGFLRTRVEQNTDALAENIYGESQPNANWDDLRGEDLTGLFSLLNVVVVENKRPPKELQIQKVDGKGKGLNGAKFAVYASKEDAEKEQKAIAAGATATVDEIDGMLVFHSEEGSMDGSDGRVKMDWSAYEGRYLYLRETEAPKGYQKKKTLIRLYVDENTVYADAGTGGDGVSVMAGVGKIDRTRAETTYLTADGVSLTLRDITVTAQKQSSGNFATEGWQDVPATGKNKEKNLHCGMNLAIGMEYGLHNVDLGLKEGESISAGTEDSEGNKNREKWKNAFFTTDTGFLRNRIVQNTDELKLGTYDGPAENMKQWADLSGEDLTTWFSQINIVVVKNVKSKSDSSEEEPNEPEMFFDEPPSELLEEPTVQKPEKKAPVVRRHTPQTGDDSHIWWWAVMAAVSLAGVCAAGYYLYVKRKKSTENEAEKEKNSAGTEKLNE